MSAKTATHGRRRSGHLRRRLRRSMGLGLSTSRRRRRPHLKSLRPSDHTWRLCVGRMNYIYIYVCYQTIMQVLESVFFLIIIIVFTFYI